MTAPMLTNYAPLSPVALADKQQRKYFSKELNNVARSMGQANTAITGNSSALTTAAANITTLQGNVTTLQGNVTTLQGDITGRATEQAAVSAPTAPASTGTFFMQGLAGSITPTTTGKVLIIISGTIVAPAGTTVDNGIKYQISYGTGVAPSNTGALAGTQIGTVQAFTLFVAATAAADVHIPFSIAAVVTGLTLATAYWIDLAAESVTTASDMGLSNVSITAVEI